MNGVPGPAGEIARAKERYDEARASLEQVIRDAREVCSHPLVLEAPREPNTFGALKEFRFCPACLLEEPRGYTYEKMPNHENRLVVAARRNDIYRLRAPVAAGH